jgi:predicted component of type VI protein secretion system
VALGFAPEGRFVLVVFEYDEETRWIRVVTAYEPTDSSWWKKYAKAKGLDAP